MNVKRSVPFGPVSRRRFTGTAWAGNMGWHDGKHKQRTQGDVEGTPLQMSPRPFSKYGGRHSRCSSSCHFLSRPLTFGIVGRLPCTSTGSGMEDGGVVSQGQNEHCGHIINDCTATLHGVSTVAQDSNSVLSLSAETYKLRTVLISSMIITMENIRQRPFCP